MMTDTSHTQTPATPEEANGKRPYLKPGFHHEPVFETMALACGKVQTTQNACRTRRNAS